jgi:hypothetical protein
LRTQSPLVVLSVIAAIGCGDREVPLAPVGSPDFARVIVLDGGGFDDASNSGVLNGLQWEPSGWDVLPGSSRANFDVPDQDDGCADHGICPLGHMFGGFGILGLSPFADPNPSPSGNTSNAFAVISNSNFFALESLFGFVTNLESGIERGFTLPSAPGVYLDFRIDAAFGSGQMGNGPGQNDFAVAEMLVDNSVVELIRWSRDDLQPGGQGNPVSSNVHCGTTNFGTTQAYPLCTGWQRRYVDVTRFAGRNVLVRVSVRQALPDNNIASFLAFDNVRFEGYDAVSATIDIQPNDPTNTIDLSATSLIPVVLFGSSSLNVSVIDVGSFRIGDVGTPAAAYGDFNNDGFGDVQLDFDLGQLVGGGAVTPNTTALELVGILPDRTRVRGSQPISIAGRAAIDIKPDKISLSLTGTVTVYLYSSATFDAASASAASIRWYNNGVGVGAPVAQRSGLYMTSVRDFNGDGRADRLLTFLRSDLTAAGLSTATTSFVVADRIGLSRFEASDGVPPSIVP